MQCYLHQYLLKWDNEFEIKWPFDENEIVQIFYRSHRDADKTHDTYIEQVMQKCIDIKEEETEPNERLSTLSMKHTIPVEAII